MGATYTRQSSSGIVDGGVIEATDLNNEFDQLLAAFAVSTGHTHDGTAAEGGPITKLLGTAITIGDGTSGTDIAVTFDGESADGVLTWMEDEDYFKFSDEVLMNSTEKLLFGDTGTYIHQSADGVLDLVSDSEIEINATTIDINGAVDISGNTTVGGDLTVTGDDITMGTNTSGMLLVADGTNFNPVAVSGDVTMASTGAITIAATSVENSMLAGSIADSKLSTISTADKVAGSAIQIDSGTDGTSITLADTDKFLVDDGGTTKYINASQINAYTSAAVALDDISTGDAATTLATSAGDITIDAQGSDTDIIFKGTDGGADTTFLTIDGSAAGAATFNDKVIATELDISGNMDIDGTSNLDAVDIDGAVQIDNTVTVGVDDTGYDVKFFGDTASAYMLWDTSADDLILGGAAGLIVPDGQFTLGSTAVTTTAAEINLIDGGTSRGTTAVADGDGLLVNDGGTMRMTNVTTLKTYFQSGASVAADDISTGDGAVTIATSSGNITIDAQAGDADIIFKGTDSSSDITALTLDMSDAGSATFNHDVILGNNSFVQFGDAGEKMLGDGTDLTINSSNDLNLTATTDINIPANVGLTFGDDAEKIEGDGTDLTISGNNINLTATADVNIPSGVGLTFATAEKIESDGTDLSITVGSGGDINVGANIGVTFGDDGEKIEGDGTDLTIASSAKINLTATSDVHIPNNVGIVFGGDSEKIEGDGTDMTISANNLTVDAAADINLDADGADVNIKDGGTTIISFTNSSSDAVITAGVQDKDIIFKGDDGGSAVTSLTLDMSNSGAAVFSAAAYNAEATLTDASTISWNAITQPVCKVTLGANRTIGAASGGVAGAFISILVIQDGTGSRTVTWNAAYEFASDTAPTLTTTASKGDLFVFRYNGSKWLEVGRNLALTLS